MLGWKTILDEGPTLMKRRWDSWKEDVTNTHKKKMEHLWKEDVANTYKKKWDQWGGSPSLHPIGLFI
jgi:hypothetical protein